MFFTGDLQSRKALHKTAPKAKGLTKAIALMIAVGLFPYSLVEDSAFKNVLNIAEPGYTIPCRTTFSRTIVPQLYLQERERIQSEICNDLSQGNLNQYKLLTIPNSWVKPLSFV